MCRKEILPLYVRVEVINDSKAGLSQLKHSDKNNCGKTQIYNILRNKEELLDIWCKSGNKGIKKKIKTFKQMNEIILDFFHKASARRIISQWPNFARESMRICRNSENIKFCGK